MWYTDDVGKTWAASNTLMKKMDEAQLVELGDGIVMANMRNQHLQVRLSNTLNEKGNTRAVSISMDGGENFGPIYYDPALIDPICAASIIRDYRTNVIYFSNAAHPTKRINMSVKRSSNWGKTWDRTLLVYEGPSAYSDMIDLDSDEFIGMTWETNSTGCVGESCRTLFSFIPKNFSPVWQTNTTITTAANDLPPLLLVLLLRDPHLLEGSQRALRLTSLAYPHDDRPSGPGVKRTVDGLRAVQLRLERLPSTRLIAPTAFRREDSSLSSRADRPFMQQPPPASTMLEVSSLRIYSQRKTPNTPPHRSSECSCKSCSGVGAPHPRVHVTARQKQCRFRS